MNAKTAMDFTQYLPQIFENLPTILIIADNNLVIQKTNRAIENLGYTGTDLIGTSLSTLFTHNEPEVFFKNLFAHKSIINYETEALSINGVKWPVLINLVVLESLAPHAPLILCTLQDIAECKKTELKLRHLARHDFLTDLPNRLQLIEVLEREIARCQRTQSIFGLILLDLDNFKEINDTLGHMDGDYLLQEIAIRLRSSIRISDFVARFGGDEFVIVVPDIKQAADLERIAKYLQTHFARPFAINNNDYFIHFSMGIVTYSAASSDAEELLKHADIALYRAKSVGKNNYQYYNKTNL